MLYYWLFKVEQQFMANSQQENKNHVTLWARADWTEAFKDDVLTFREKDEE